jgi:hypothetical protein
MGATYLKCPFDERKAAEASSYILALHGQGMDRWRFNKIMYLAEREAWERFERPMFGGTYFSMEHGPIVSEILDLTRDRQLTGVGRVWSEYFKNVGLEVRQIKKAHTARLTRGDVEILNSVFQKFGRLTDKSLRTVVHGLPEYSPTTVDSKRWPITIEELLDKIGKPRGVVSRISAGIKEDRTIERLHRKLAHT